MEIDIKPAKPQVIAVAFSSREYNEELTNLVRLLSDNYRAICYVSVNTVYNELINKLSKSGIDISRIFFIDAITKTFSREQVDSENCIFVDSPNSLTDISRHATEFLSSNKFDCFLFDSLSTMIIYEKSIAVTRFVHFMIENFRQYKCSAVFTILESDVESDFMKHIGLFVDKVYSKEIANEKMPAEAKISAEKTQKWENELNALEEANRTGFISDESYKKGKERLEKALNVK